MPVMDDEPYRSWESDAPPSAPRHSALHASTSISRGGRDNVEWSGAASVTSQVLRIAAFA